MFYSSGHQLSISPYSRVDYSHDHSLPSFVQYLLSLFLDACLFLCLDIESNENPESDPLYLYTYVPNKADSDPDILRCQWWDLGAQSLQVRWGKKHEQSGDQTGCKQSFSQII